MARRGRKRTAFSKFIRFPGFTILNLSYAAALLQPRTGVVAFRTVEYFFALQES